MRKNRSRWKKWLLMLTLCALVTLLVYVAYPLLAGSFATAGQLVSGSPLEPHIMAQSNLTAPNNTILLNGRVPSLSWIIGRDCRSGIQAYLRSVASNPDAALVGTGWVDPTTGLLINGEINCTPGNLSMDSVVQLVHQHGGKAYLTITMATNGAPGLWTEAQETAYVVKAAQMPSLLDPIVREVQRLNYDGVIMDLETVSNSYPHIQQIFATYNQQLWHLLQPLQKLYGIALLHKTSDHDEYYGLNGFEDWSLLAQSADFLVVMAVDQSYWTPGPSVSVPWLQQLLNYTLKTMPQMLPRIIWELPLYGDTWHRAPGGQWVYEKSIDYQSAMQSVDQVGRAQVDPADSAVQDPYQPHLVYTDAANVTHELWFMSAQSLSNIVRDFQQLLRKQPRFGLGKLQFAVWWRTTSEPQDFWQKVGQLY